MAFATGFLGQADVNYLTSLTLLFGFNLLLFVLAYRLLKKGVGIRS